MLFKPPKVHYHTAKLLLLGVLLCIFTAGSAMAAPKVCKKNCPPVPESPDNYVFWGVDENSMFFEYGFRQCSLSQAVADFSSGTYDCVLNTDPVDYKVSAAPSVQIYTRGNDWYCGDGYADGYDDLMQHIPNLQYSYSWSGDCTTGCDVTITNRIEMNSSMYRSITIEGFVSGVTTADPEGNPFAQAQNLEIERLLVTKFAPKGKSKILAMCESFPGPGMVTFHTSLDPVTPD